MCNNNLSPMRKCNNNNNVVTVNPWKTGAGGFCYRARIAASRWANRLLAVLFHIYWTGRSIWQTLKLGNYPFNLQLATGAVVWLTIYSRWPQYSTYQWPSTQAHSWSLQVPQTLESRALPSGVCCHLPWKDKSHDLNQKDGKYYEGFILHTKPAG